MVDHLEDVLLGGPDVLWVRDGLDPNLGEAVSEGRGEFFLAVVATWVHCSNDTKAWLGLDCLPAIATLYSH